MILDGKIVAADIKQRLKEEIDAAVVNGCRRPRLVIISVGDDPASKVYVRNKMKAAEEVGIEVKTTEYGAIWCLEGTYIMFESGERCPYCD